jgi:hypothetical protein
VSIRLKTTFQDKKEKRWELYSYLDQRLLASTQKPMQSFRKFVKPIDNPEEIGEILKILYQTNIVRELLKTSNSRFAGLEVP